MYFFLFYVRSAINCTPFDIGYAKPCVWWTFCCKCGSWIASSTVNFCRTVCVWWIYRIRRKRNATILWSTYFRASQNVFSTNMVLPARYRNTIRFVFSRWTLLMKKLTFSSGFGSSYWRCCWLDCWFIGKFSATQHRSKTKSSVGARLVRICSAIQLIQCASASEWLHHSHFGCVLVYVACVCLNHRYRNVRQ